MTPEEINKKIAELLHSRLNLINGELLSSGELQKEVEGAAKEITDKVFEEISSCTTIKGWVARDKELNISGKNAVFPVCFFYEKPERGRSMWVGHRDIYFPDELLPEVTWESGPKKVSVTIKAE